MPGHPDGPGPRAHELPPLPDAVRDQAPASCWDYTSGETVLILSLYLYIAE